MNFLVSQLNRSAWSCCDELVPNSRVIGFMVRPSNPASTADTRESNGATRLGVKLLTFRVEKDQDFDAPSPPCGTRVSIVLVHTDPFFNSNRSKLVALAERHAVPAMYELREFVMEGGLASYGTNIVEAYRQLGLYAGRIVKGEKPSDLPVSSRPILNWPSTSRPPRR